MESNKRGGKRSGAGRKPGSIKRVLFSARLQEDIFGLLPVVNSREYVEKAIQAYAKAHPKQETIYTNSK
jgi:hypothetical protein